MERLIDNDLIYGGLLQVTQPHLVERYNAALKQFGLSATELGAFSIDATGYSPEIADAFGDEYYLDPHGINRRFIILSPEQGTLPVVNINFSSTTDLVHEFFQQNEEALRVLTLKDVVYGEIDNSTYRVDDLDDILSIKRVDFVVKTAGNLLDKARSLEALLDNFHNDADGWKDDALLNEMLELSRDVGDPRNNAIIPGHTKFEQKSFWTRHFDGIYVFHDDGEEAVVIGPEELPAFALGQVNLKRYLSLTSYDDVYSYLYNTDRLELWNAAWLEKSEILDLRIKQLIYAAVTRANPKANLLELDDVWIRNWVRDNFELLAEDGAFPFLTRMKKNAFNDKPVDLDEVRPEHRFLTMRANPDHPDHWVVNRLLSEYVPFDFITRYIVNKEAFYQDYQSFESKFRDYVVHAVTSTYFPQRREFLDRMFDQ